MIDISIIIVNWNAKQHLLNCLNSIIGTAKEYSQEIIVVDNDSSDSSNDAVAKQFPQVKLIENKENLGFAKANNIGIQVSTGRYVCLVNSDIVVLNNCIKSLIDFMNRQPKVGMAGPRILNSDRTLQCSCRHFPTIWNNVCQSIGLNYLFPKSAFFSEPIINYWTHDKERKVDILSGCFWIVRRKAMNEVGLLDEDFFIYGEDIDWCKRFHQAGWDITFCPDAEAIHFGGASSSKAPIKFYLEMVKADLHYWKKHHGKLGAATYTMILIFRHALRMISGSVQYIFCPSQRENARFKLHRNAACMKQIFSF